MIHPRDVSRGSGLTLVVTIALAWWPARAEAQIGSGWTEFTPVKSIQLRGAGARYSNENGIETFSIQPGDERAEARIEDDHRTGTWQFEGWVNVKPGVTGGCIHQVFKFLMIVAYPDGGGELRQHSQQRLAATGVYDKWVRVNTIHDADAGRADVYIDGTWRGMVASKSPGPNGWYHKYGIYNSSSTRPVVQWRNIKFWKGGKGGPADAAPNPGAGPPDAAVTPVDASADVVVAPVDASTDGGSDGAGGTRADAAGGGGAGAGAGGGGGSAGSGGTAAGSGGRAGGTGGTRNTGGSAAATPDAPAKSGGCSFALGAHERTYAPAAFALALVALLRRRRRP